MKNCAHDHTSHSDPPIASVIEVPSSSPERGRGSPKAPLDVARRVLSAACDEGDDNVGGVSVEDFPETVSPRHPWIPYL